MKIVAILECPKCGGWRDVAYRDLDPAAAGCVAAWRCFGCGKFCPVRRGIACAAAIPDETDGRFYDRWLDGCGTAAPASASAYREPRADVRPVLEPLL